jgi:hypothetical protein
MYSIAVALLEWDWIIRNSLLRVEFASLSVFGHRTSSDDFGSPLVNSLLITVELDVYRGHILTLLEPKKHCHTYT